jgi:flagellar protein FlaG
MALEISHSLTVLHTARSGKGGSAPSRPSAQLQSVSHTGEVTGSKDVRPLSSEVVDNKADPAKQDRQPVADSQSLAQLVDMVNERPQIKNRSLQFSVHEGTGKMLVRVYDADTDELIRQFPPDELLALAERIQEVLEEDSAGIMLQEKA